MPNDAITRRRFLQNSSAAGLSAALVQGCAGTQRSKAAQKKHPNLLFVFSDQHRARDMGCMGHPQVQTPHLDAMAQRGTIFENTVSCCPVCTPYRGVLLSGQNPLRTGVFLNDVRLPTDLTGIAHVLGRAGYRTGYIGKWHLDGDKRGGFTPPGPRRQGFDDYWAVANCNHDYMKAYYYLDEPEPIWIDGYESDAQTTMAVDFIESTPKDRPFCLFLSWGPPHNPYNLMPDSYKIYPSDGVFVPPNCKNPNREELAGYLAHITALDKGMGRLLAALDRQGLTESTMVIYTSDHGDMLGSHGHSRKQKPWDESVQVPMIVQQPGTIPGGVRSRAMLNTPDYLPTLARLCGADIPAAAEGSDLSDVWLGHREQGPESAWMANFHGFGESPNFPIWRGVRTPQHSYICKQDGPWMLFDNQADPYQMTNLCGAPSARSIQRRLEGTLSRWMDRNQDTFEDSGALIQRFGHRIDPRRKQAPYSTKIGDHDLDS